MTKVIYGYSYLRLTRKHRETVEVVNREAMRVVTGLPRLTENVPLVEHAQMNRLAHLVEEHRQGQIERFRETRAGRKNLV